MQLNAGETAPSFALPDADMETVDLAAHLGKKCIVLFFYPKDGTPCCTREATDFSDHEEDFAEQDCLVFGISRNDCLEHAEFRDREGIGLTLLSDADGAVCKRYGVWQAKEVGGQKKFGIARSTFIIDRAGSIRHALYNVNYKGHALDVLRLVKEMNS
ncbi:MAG: peroxiredoxin [Betaproteobacteria bacterium]|nr:peroxiredoxin [Betaproteobacteria bacterium]MCL2887631.1 peroxiredoxin [Betaproteobacteria bacterium]